MRISKITIAAIMTVAVLSTGASGQVKSDCLDFSKYKFRSSLRATQYSVMGALIPVATGLVWLHHDNDNSSATIPVLLIVSGVVLGPSTGYFYGDCPERAVTGILIRVGTGALTALVAGAAADAHKSERFMDFSGLEAALTVGAIGSGMILIEAIVDIALVKRVVEKKNIKKARKNRPDVTLLPAYFAHSGASGMQLQVSF